MAGLELPSAGRRVDRLIELVEAVNLLLSGETVTKAGGAVTLHEAKLSEPRPSQHPIPLMVGGNGPRVLRFAARSADLVGVSGLSRTLADGHSHSVEWGPAALERTFDLVSTAATAAGRSPDIEALVQRVEITDDPEAVAISLAERIPGASPDDILATPFMWIGSPADIAAQIEEFERRWGVNRYVVRDAAVEAAGAVVTLLNGSA
jgi:alkanesulfonate monooxygenase SsuD/methylene tetrahydromethanopterin reductase-like flavin-dependent oxidoreductase (luciferase family)